MDFVFEWLLEGRSFARLGFIMVAFPSLGMWVWLKWLGRVERRQWAASVKRQTQVEAKAARLFRG